MIYGMSTACFFPGVLLEDTIDIMGRMHIEHIEVFFNCMSEYQKPFVKELKKRIDDNGMSVYSMHAFSIQFEPQLFTLHERARREAEEIYKWALEAAAELGAGVYVFHGPPNLKRARKTVLNYEHISKTAGNIADIAKTHGVKLAWENVHWCWYSDPDFASSVMNMPGTENLYFTLDVKQAAQAGFHPSDYMLMTGQRLANIHICDCAYSEDRGIYPVLPFKGGIDFEAIKKTIHKTGYDDGIILEVYSSNYSDYSELEDNFNKVKAFFMK